jgi:predicted nucleic acid-binding protein
MPPGTSSVPDPAAAVVLDAAALVDLLAETELAAVVRARLAGSVLHAPAHLDAEALSALGRMQRAGVLTTRAVDHALTALADAPITRHPLAPLLAGAWARRRNTRLTDALYVELAEHLELPLVTTDRRLARVAAPAVLAT